ncbi:MAG: hypothetical protein LBI35_00830 [Burkholderiales bacterium]|jgi:hypothetical protein|nr:hypothetical protein [Burkholderiales bacterium]
MKKRKLEKRVRKIAREEIARADGLKVEADQFRAAVARASCELKKAATTFTAPSIVVSLNQEKKLSVERRSQLL